MHEFFAKIARFAVSKAAAFCYAVTVGVSGQLAYSYLQPTPAPTVTATPLGVTAAPAPVPAPAPPAAVTSAPITAPTPVVTAAPAPLPNGSPLSPMPISNQPEAARPTPARPAAIAPILRDTPAAALPNVSALPTPTLKPSFLPPKEPAAAADVTAVVPLPPIGPAIDVAVAPGARTSAESVPAAAVSVTEPAKRQPWELSDFWHPVRAAEKGLDWAGDQVPLIGGAAAQPQSRTAAPGGPIPLLPSAAAATLPETEKAAAPALKPGPGSGGLY